MSIPLESNQKHRYGRALIHQGFFSEEVINQQAKNFVVFISQWMEIYKEPEVVSSCLKISNPLKNFKPVIQNCIRFVVDHLEVWDEENLDISPKMFRMTQLCLNHV
ncbi:hypothetical protein BUALT_Bualt02G0090800 [Buddleja alternifolia]|uniref:Uncharacterized protein n=1 Tax=Buddleja alternifolia TaxID=168488 RepID=A0AAV6Y6P9_9LAMI|nr:hypothetical protein BUALT_Bualt02G0090800 [Buddleja alternifolia]